MENEKDKIIHVLNYHMNRDRNELTELPLYYLKLGVSNDSYLTVNKKTLYMMMSDKELDNDILIYNNNKFTLNEIDLLLCSDNDLIKNRKMFILEKVL